MALASDLNSSDELVRYAKGDWRILLTGACNPSEEQLKYFYDLKDNTIESELYIQRSLWDTITDESEPLTEVAWTLANDREQLSITTLLKIFELQKHTVTPSNYNGSPMI